MICSRLQSVRELSWIRCSIRTYVKLCPEIEAVLKLDCNRVWRIAPSIRAVEKIDNIFCLGTYARVNDPSLRSQRKLENGRRLTAGFRYFATLSIKTINLKTWENTVCVDVFCHRHILGTSKNSLGYFFALLSLLSTQYVLGVIPFLYSSLGQLL